MAVNRQQKGSTYRTPQEIANNSYDEQYAIETTALMGYRLDLDAFVPINLDSLGNIAQSLKGANAIQFATISASSSGDNQIVAAVASKKIKVLSVVLVASGTVSAKWRSGTTDISGSMPFVANSGLVLPASSPGQGHYFETAVNTALNINLSGAVIVTGHISYYLEA